MLTLILKPNLNLLTYYYSKGLGNPFRIIFFSIPSTNSVTEKGVSGNKFAANYELLVVIIKIYFASQKFKIRAFPDVFKANKRVHSINLIL